MQVNIYFLNGNDLEIQNHYLQKSYRNDVVVEVNNIFYEVYFYVDGVMTYEMKKDGFFSFPGLIVLDEITFDKICKAIDHLVDLQYFDRFKGVDTGPYIDRFDQKWYRLSPFTEGRLSVHRLRG